MNPFEGVEVEITSEGEKLTLYNDPDEEPDQDPRTQQRYIEAITGATFAVKVEITKNFRLCGLRLDDALRTVINYDGDPTSWCCDFSTNQIWENRNSELSTEIFFSHVPSFCHETQRWKTGATSFGALHTKEMTDSTIPLAKVQQLGRIKLQIMRCHRTLLNTPIPAPKRSTKRITEVAEKMLKGRAIANTVCTANEVASKAPPHTKYDLQPISGLNGEPLVYNILYRPRRSLQMLGCIPRSRSPEPTVDKDAELRALRARVAFLERESDVKAEPGTSRAGIKREREDAENDVTRKRSRGSGSIETIDLTRV